MNLKIILYAIKITLFLGILSFILISLPNVIIDYGSYNYYVALSIISIVFSMIIAFFLIKSKKKIIGFLLICFSLITACGCLVTRNGISSFKAKVIFVGDNSVVLEKDNSTYEIKKPPIIKLKANDYIYVKYDNNKNNMHYIISPLLGRIAIIIGGVIMIPCILYGGYSFIIYKKKLIFIYC